ncbi:cytochrome P450 [Microdochium bolleyi]|uniref:Cytochrome P450 n=1 Tax=Microdochium bolleyi TaxID=196109 RepID=A0A136IT51_9PEZI|nr:cytochrome P450 [Microdochium bolleyi]
MADTTIRDKLEVAGPVVAVLAGALVLLPWVTSNHALSKFPLVGKELGTEGKRRAAFLENASKIHKTGYAMFRNVSFRLTESEGEIVVMPIGYLEELRKFPDDVLSTVEPIRQFLQTHYLGIRGDDELLNHVIRSDLNHKLNSVNEKLSSEVALTIPEHLGKSRDWTSINIFGAMLRMVAIISGHIFLGPELNRREEYLHASINYTIDLFKAATQLRSWPLWLRPIGQFFVPDINSVKEHRRRAKEFLVPIVRERQASRAAPDGSEEPDDMLQWMLAKAEKFGNTDEGYIAELQLTLSLAAIHTTTMTVTHVIYDLIAYCPEVIPELQSEIRTVLADNGGVMTTQALFQMKLLDSVMRESQRHNPTTATSFRRKVLKDVTLSDGTFLPRGSLIGVPQYGVSMDPELYPDPAVFNPSRFSDIRSGEAPNTLGYSNKEQYQFISVNKEHTGFGYGRHACPGRFFAANEIKLVLARILVDYEIKMPPGETGRYTNLMQIDNVTPDPRKSVMFKYVGQ